MKNKRTLYPSIWAVLISALIVGLGLVYLVYSSPGTTTIGEDISTTNLTVSGNATTTGNQVISGNLNVSGISALATTTATKLTVSGALDITEGALTDSKVLSVDIKDGEIVNADISSSALIDISKLATTTAGNIIIANSSNVPTYIAMSGDATIDSSGALTVNQIKGKPLGSIATTSGHILIADGTDYDSVAVSGDITIAADGTASISSGVIVNADVSSTAAIDGTKISPDFGSQNIVTTGSASSSSLIIGGGTAISKHSSATTSVSFTLSTIDTCTVATTSISASSGDVVAVGMPDTAAALSGSTWGVWVSGSNEVSLRYCTGNTTTSDAALDVRFDIWQH